MENYTQHGRTGSMDMNKFLVASVDFPLPESRRNFHYSVVINRALNINMEMQHGHGHAAWKWTCSLDIDKQHGHGHATGK
jgi:hypothetical protein